MRLSSLITVTLVPVPAPEPHRKPGHLSELRRAVQDKRPRAPGVAWTPAVFSLSLSGARDLILSSVTVVSGH